MHALIMASAPTQYCVVLQEYSPAKRAEHAIKALRYDGSSVSVVDPSTYASRFTTFLRQKVFQ